MVALGALETPAPAPGWRLPEPLWHSEAVPAHATRPASERTDEELGEALRAADPAALEALYDRHASALFGLAMRMRLEADEAEDLVHDVFVEAWRSAASYDATRGTIGAWLRVRLRSRAIDRIRRKGIDPTRLADDVERHADGASEAPSPSRSVDQGRAMTALATLSDDQRRVVELAYFAGLSFREIGARLSIPTTTAKSRMVAAVRILRERMGVSRAS